MTHFRRFIRAPRSLGPGKLRHPAALRLAMDRICPTRDGPVAFELPTIASADDAVGAMASIVQGLADGDITPSEAAKLARVVQTFTQTVSTAVLEQQVQDLLKKGR